MPPRSVVGPPKRSHHAKPPEHVVAFANRITGHFKPPPPPPQVGRPAAVPFKKRGRAVARPPPLAETATPAPSLGASSSSSSARLSSAGSSSADSSSAGPTGGKRASAAIVGVKLKRTNWGRGEPLARMTKAVADWDAKTGEILETDVTMSLRSYAKCVNIQFESLYDYCRPQKGKRKVLGSSVGNPPLFDIKLEQFAVDVMRRHDRGNDGLDRRDCIDLLHEMKPGSKRKHIMDAFDRTVRPRHKEVLTGIIKANATTSKRTAITVPQQFRWHSTIDHSLAFLREKNIGVTPDGKSFGEVIDHFVLGGDETCFLASAGSVGIIGDKKKPKHDLPTGQDRTSATVYRMGSSAGATGPTAFLPPGASPSPPTPTPFTLTLNPHPHPHPHPLLRAAAVRSARG